MQIEKVTITNKELREAVGDWMKTKGIYVPVERVHKPYSYESDWTIEFVDLNPVEPTAPAEPPTAAEAALTAEQPKG